MTDSISPLDGRYRNEVSALYPYFSEEALVRSRIRIEGMYLVELSHKRLVPPLTEEEVRFLTKYLPNSSRAFLRVKAIERRINHDTKSVELFMREEMQDSTLQDLIPLVHIGLTSTDIDNLAWGVLFQQALNSELIPTLGTLIEQLAVMAREYADHLMLGRTHGQPAVPMNLGEVFQNFLTRLNGEKKKLERVRVPGKLSGAVGNFSALKVAYPEVDWPQFAKEFVAALGLNPKQDTTQIPPYEDLCEIFDVMRRINLIVVDLDRDIWSYLSYGDLILPKVGQEVGSSTMPQKVNPIQFEMSEANLKIANALLEMLSRELIPNRMQRDLTDKELMRVVGEAWGYSYLSWKFTLSGLKRVRANKEGMERNLSEHWEVLGETIQTILRKHNDLEAYERVQKLLQGRTLDRLAYHRLILDLEPHISKAAAAEIAQIGL